MIGKIIIGKSFRGCISYCLENKLSVGVKEHTENRSEVLLYSMCFGNKLELIKQFNAVRNLNPKLAKPVMHITLSFAPGEVVEKAAMQHMVENCANDLGFVNNQYLAVTHNDTLHQHIHIIANRIGFDGKTVRDNHNFQKIANYCRKMELEHGLRQVLNPKRYLNRDMRKIPRVDNRRELVRKNIAESLSKASNYREFEDLMRKKNYVVNKARGIAFTDPQKVRIKGSEVGFSLAKIERILSMSLDQKKTLLQRIKSNSDGLDKADRKKLSFPESIHEKPCLLAKEIDILLKQEYMENAPQELVKKNRKKKKGYQL